MPPPMTATASWNEFRERANEEGVIVECLRALHAQVKFVCDGARVDVEIVEYLDMIAEESDRAHHDVATPMRFAISKGVFDIGLEPWIARRSAAALIGDTPVMRSDSVRNRCRRAA